MYEEKFSNKTIPYREKENEVLEIFQKNSKVLVVYLFGSFAINREKAGSDIDFAILLDSRFSKQDQFKTEMFLLDELINTLNSQAIDLLCLNTATIEMQYEIITSGRVIHVKNETERIFFETITIMKYLDFKPFLEAHRKTLL